MDILEKVKSRGMGPLGQYSQVSHGYYSFPKLEGEIGPRMQFKGQEKIIWSINSYLGLANHPEIRKIDEEASREWGLAYPMGARIMSGESDYHERLERELAEFVQKGSGLLLNFGYQGIMSIVDALVDRHDVIVYDKDSHACIYDGIRMHMGKRLPFEHNDFESFKKQLAKADIFAQKSGGGILVISEGVFGMRGNQGILKEIVSMKDQYNFTFLVDDAHGFGVLGETGAGAGEAQGVQDQIDVYFSTFAKSMASIGAFVAADRDTISYFRYNLRSQIFAKSLPMPLVVGNLKRLEMLRTMPELREKLWRNVHMLQNGLREAGFDLGTTSSCVTPVYMHGSVSEVANLVYDMRENYHVFCSPVMYPIIPKGILLLRLIPTAAHSEQDVQETIDAFKACRAKLDKGEYERGMPQVEVSPLV